MTTNTDTVQYDPLVSTYPNVETLGQLLKAVREAKEQSAVKAAEEVGVSRLTYSMWERDVWSPKNNFLEYIDKIRDYTSQPEEVVLALMGVLTHDAAKVLRRAVRRGTLSRVIPGYVSSENTHLSPGIYPHLNLVVIDTESERWN